ncbi:MAG: YebC/PmpR family DNA-binding transcriptional regulator [Ichthyobacteriaceae bacterium]|nr:YebC/PmpR family DNA-binding transcriptional regulator [Ichthyobacteriaceae bacterium]
MGRAFEFRKGRKMKRWAAMSKAFTRLSRDITMAVKENGPDPEANLRLKMLIQNSKAANMPKDNIVRAIKKATDKNTANYKVVNFEGYAPHGIAVLVETATDNNTRTVANVRSYFNKTNGNLATTGSVEFLFEHKCLFKIAKGDINDESLEELEFELIDAGCEEIGIDEEEIIIYGEFSAFGDIHSKLEELNHEIISSEFEWVPMDLKELNEDEMADVDKLLEKLEEDEDVQYVFHNMA